MLSLLRFWPNLILPKWLERGVAANALQGASSIPPEIQVVYAVGDVHGCFDQFRDMAQRIAADATQYHLAACAVVYLGDLIDRGPRSSEVIEALLTARVAGFPRYCVAGNHERALLDFLERPEYGAKWLAIGGAETLRSYGITLPTGRPSKQVLRNLAMEAAASIPQDHVEFLRKLPIALTWERYLFVHAGLRPGLPLERQDPKDLLEIREPFLRSGASFPHIVVHGHSPSRNPERFPSRISLDTGCYATGRLAAARIQSQSVEFLTVDNNRGPPKGDSSLQ